MTFPTTEERQIAQKRQFGAKKHRRGSALIIAIVVLLLCSMFSLSLVKTTMHRQLRFTLRQRQLQSQLFADAALDRFVSTGQQINNESPMKWTIQLEDELGEVTARIDASSQTTKTMIVDINAAFPKDLPDRVQTSYTAKIALKELDDDPSEPTDDDTPVEAL